MSVRVRILEGPLTQRPEPPANGAGAVFVFDGIVRPREGAPPHDTPIAALDYTAYRPMADQTLEAIAREALQRFGLLAIDVEHSLGRVNAGESSFRLAIHAAHRREALDAANWFIDRMKADVPIWKAPVRA